jgi:hypothetical protein
VRWRTNVGAREWGRAGSEREQAWEWVSAHEGGWVGGGLWAREARHAGKGLWAKVGPAEGRVFSFFFFNFFLFPYIYIYISILIY